MVSCLFCRLKGFCCVVSGGFFECCKVVRRVVKLSEVIFIGLYFVCMPFSLSPLPVCLCLPWLIFISASVSVCMPLSVTPPCLSILIWTDFCLSLSACLSLHISLSVWVELTVSLSHCLAVHLLLCLSVWVVCSSVVYLSISIYLSFYLSQKINTQISKYARFS